MSIQALAEARDALTVKRVYGDPYEHDGMTVIPAAEVRGAGGGGGGESPEGKGDGGGFGVSARPAGAWIVRDGTAQWQPAVNVGRIVVVAELVALAGVLAWRSVALARLQRPLLPVRLARPVLRAVRLPRPALRAPRRRHRPSLRMRRGALILRRLT